MIPQLQTVEWHPISSGLPDSDTAVLIATPDSESEDVWVGYHDGEIWRQIGGDPVEGRVTHWMQFPVPPAATISPQRTEDGGQRTATTNARITDGV